MRRTLIAEIGFIIALSFLSSQSSAQEEWPVIALSAATTDTDGGLPCTSTQPCTDAIIIVDTPQWSATPEDVVSLQDELQTLVERAEDESLFVNSIKYTYHDRFKYIRVGGTL